MGRTIFGLSRSPPLDSGRMAETLGLHGSTIAQRIKPRRTQELINQRSSYFQCQLLCGETSVSHLLHLLLFSLFCVRLGPLPFGTGQEPPSWPVYICSAHPASTSQFMCSTSQFMCCRVGLMGPPLIPHLVHAFTIYLVLRGWQEVSLSCPK